MAYNPNLKARPAFDDKGNYLRVALTVYARDLCKGYYLDGFQIVRLRKTKTRVKFVLENGAEGSYRADTILATSRDK